MNSSLKERFERLGPTQVIDRISSGSTAVFILRPARAVAGVQTVTATLALVRRGLSVLQAKRATEALLDQGRTAVDLPNVEDVAAVVRDLASMLFTLAQTVHLVPSCRGLLTRTPDARCGNSQLSEPYWT